jgi:hypothetical protein
MAGLGSSTVRVLRTVGAAGWRFQPQAVIPASHPSGPVNIRDRTFRRGFVQKVLAEPFPDAVAQGLVLVNLEEFARL